MKMRVYLFCLSVVLCITLAISSAIAGVCFVVGDCGEGHPGQQVLPRCTEDDSQYAYRDGENIVTTCDGVQYSQKIGSSGPLVCVGACYREDGANRCSGWKCDPERFPLQDEGSGKYQYLDPCCDHGDLSYGYRRCAASYLYVASEDYNLYISAHNTVKKCESPKELDGDSCVETYGLLNSVSYTRYKECKCPTSFVKCGEYAHGIGSACKNSGGEDVYASCECTYGSDNGVCLPNTGGGGGSCTITNVSKELSKGNTFNIYYIQDKDMPSVINEAWSKFSKKKINAHYNLDDKDVDLVLKDYKDVFYITVHPLIAMNDDNMVRINLGLDFSDAVVPADLPFLFTAEMYGPSLYGNLCYKDTEHAGEYDDKPLIIDNGVDFDKMTLEDMKDAPIFGSLAENDKYNCHPNDFYAAKQYGYEDPFKYAGDKDIVGWGGDKCINYVFQNQKIWYPRIVGDADSSIAYVFSDGGARYSFVHGIFNSDYWVSKTKCYKDKKGNSHTDWQSDFLVWNIDPKGFKIREDKEVSTFDQVCVDKATDYKDFDVIDVATYPFMVSDDGNNIVDNYIAEKGFQDLYDSLSGDPDKDGPLWLHYYNHNFENFTNGKYEWSYPWKYIYPWK